ncbi:GNAT family N-acetyltransferase [Kitasatospora sp. NBC_01287]|uniref:GNAT family N-acetyltransferase n=1 Tax=Kitasatospora sp. NBC_01287 TaxID=2903573 RepID=UPI00224CE6B1|nr:N-acetyltransferase [Kitasatospora sp. NBC_01287]MCX4744610.1 GNAT family N-acetyltransferase [Kitasatospora sp. NBC_01287]
MSRYHDDHLQPDGAAERLLAARGASITVRPALEGDLPALARLEALCFAEQPYPFFVLRQLFDVHGRHLLVIGTSTEVYGYVLLAAGPGRDRNWVLSIAVAAEYRGHGYGRRLMTELHLLASAEGIGDLWVTVAPENAASLTLAHSLGYVVAGRAQDYLGPGQDRLVMVCRAG